MASLFKKTCISKQLLIALSTTLPLTGHTANNEDKLEIEQLRSEVNELKALIKQYNVRPVENTQSEVKPASSTTEKTSSDLLKLTTKSGAQFQLYGFIRGDSSYQFKGGNGIFNRIHKVDLEGQETNKERFYNTMTTTRFGLDFKTPLEGQQIGGKLEVDFRGGVNNDTIRLRHVYLTYNNWLFGQTTSSFLATDLQPDMLDFGSPLGIGTFRTPLVRYNNKFTSGPEYFISLEKGRDENRLPALSGKLKYDFEDGSISTRAMVQELRIPAANNEKELSWGAAIGASYQASPKLKLMADYSHVKGDDRFLLYTNNAYLLNDTNTQVYLNEFDSFTTGVSYQFTSKIKGTLGYGAMFAKDHNGFAEQDILSDQGQNKTLQQGWLYMMYTPIAPVTFGLEYIYGERKTFSDQKGIDNRLEAMVRYNF
ncbi:DcaP family trimeric outer membrane transporter [Acinetobacter vivianii]|uniref:DcaP family trimeric outer membrane transporter n=1 Tax=Acinetobacter vivianii TaxID=1776742 RepID=UPI002DBE780C|nr:DcaP family trimeric outer membrane transporter [Acinetobacter vivianii]MEB6665906.1 DcaP family trimeric outer membrane transporter [Acinetobacter vivianii]